MRLALFQPDMPQNTGTMLRLGACVDVEVDIIEPCGFVFDERALRRYGMDYLELVKYRRHNSWDDFCSYAYGHPEEYGRIILLTTKSPLRTASGESADPSSSARVTRVQFSYCPLSSSTSLKSIPQAFKISI